MGSIGDSAGERAPLPPGVHLRVALEEDNDALGLTPHTTDDLYTQGARLSVRWRAADETDGSREMGVVFGQEIYTPTQGNLQTTDLATLRRDRPYAGWLFAALLLRWESVTSFALRLGVDTGGPGERLTELVTAVGVTGRPSAAADLQDGFHALIRRWSGNASSPLSPVGWSVYQTATRATLDTSVRTQLDLVQAGVALGSFTAETGALFAASLSPRARLDLGSSVDAASLGLELRTGLLVPRWLRRRPSFPFELWGFARADGHYVLHNAFIEGPLRNDIAPLVGIEPWVAELAAGVVLRLGAFEIGFSQVWTTREFVPSPPGARGLHQFGQISVAWAGR